MTRQEAEDFVYESYMKAEAKMDYAAPDREKRHPEYTRELIRAAQDMPADRPQKASQSEPAPCILITGSKGKGSTAAMIAKILQPVGNIGLMTSPHVTDFRERFRVNGKMIPEMDFIRIIETIRPDIEALQEQIERTAPGTCISPMGIQAILALRYFAMQRTRINVMECGKGARYDDVNNVRHEYSVINSIFLEHTRELGGTLEEIAADKSFIITGEQKAVFIGRQQDSVREVLLKRAEDMHVSAFCAGRDFGAENIRYTRDGMMLDAWFRDEDAGSREYVRDLKIPLLGEHQAHNLVLALAVCRKVCADLEERAYAAGHEAAGHEAAGREAVTAALADLSLPGRMEIYRTEPFTLLDACINRESAKMVRSVLDHLGIRRAVTLIAVPEDKDYAGIASVMKDISSEILLSGSDNPHYHFSPAQEERLKEEGIDCRYMADLTEAAAEAWRSGLPVVILGTTSVISQMHREV